MEVNLTFISEQPPRELGGLWGQLGPWSASEKTHPSPYCRHGSRDSQRQAERTVTNPAARRGNTQHRGRPRKPPPWCPLTPLLAGHTASGATCFSGASTKALGHPGHSLTYGPSHFHGFLSSVSV